MKSRASRACFGAILVDRVGLLPNGGSTFPSVPSYYPEIIDGGGETKQALDSKTMCKHRSHASGNHWLEDNKCAVKDCQCPGYESSEEEKAETRKRLRRRTRNAVG